MAFWIGNLTTFMSLVRLRGISNLVTYHYCDKLMKFNL